MITFENECVGCPPNMGCLGSACKNRNVPHYYCDVCGDELEPEELYVYSEYDKLLCKSCLTEQFKTVAEELPQILEDY